MELKGDNEMTHTQEQILATEIDWLKSELAAANTKAALAEINLSRQEDAEHDLAEFVMNEDKRLAAFKETVLKTLRDLYNTPPQSLNGCLYGTGWECALDIAEKRIKALPIPDALHKHTDQCGFDRTASLSENRYVCTCGEDHPAAREDRKIPFNVKIHGTNFGAGCKLSTVLSCIERTFKYFEDDAARGKATEPVVMRGVGSELDASPAASENAMDAERYRWLRDVSGPDALITLSAAVSTNGGHRPMTADQVDACIDAAMQATEP